MPPFRDVRYAESHFCVPHPISSCQSAAISKIVKRCCSRANIPSYLIVKLFSKNSNLCDHDTSTSRTDGRTDRQTTCLSNTALCADIETLYFINVLLNNNMRAQGIWSGINRNYIVAECWPRLRGLKACNIWIYSSTDRHVRVA